MAQLETLEAKMASIEVSLSSGTPRRKKTLLSTPLTHKLTTQPPVEIEGLRNALRDKENIIRSLRGQVHISVNNNNINNILSSGVKSYPGTNNRPEVLTEMEKRNLEERLNRLKQETESKKLVIKNLKLALGKLDITDNIDIRIQQAELEYQLGREELNLLTLLEDSRSVQSRIDEAVSPDTCGRRHGNAPPSTVHGLLSQLGGCAQLLALEVKWSSEDASFGTAVKSDGVYIEWSDRDTGLKKGDRVVEINGKLLITRTPSAADLARLYGACPDPALLVVLRGGVPPGPAAVPGGIRSELELVRERAEEAQRAKDGLRADNLRLTHRISYLEEQVHELLESRRHRHRAQAPEQHKVRVTSTSHNVTSINIGDDVQVFQKGPQVTTLVSGNKFERPLHEDEHRAYRKKHDARSVKSLELDSDVCVSGARKALDYTSEPGTPRKRPTPPAKPARLSLHRASSLQSVEPAPAEPAGRKRTRDRARDSAVRWPVQVGRQLHHRWC